MGMMFTSARGVKIRKNVVSKTGHDYAPATCTEPKTCRVCGATTGDALGHQKLYGKLNETQHTVRCYTCSKTFDNENHSFNSNNTCSKCGQKKVTTPCTTHSYQQIEKR